MTSCVYFQILFSTSVTYSDQWKQVYSHLKEKNKWQGIKILPANKDVTK